MNFSAELLKLAREIRIHRDQFDLLIVDPDTKFTDIKECEEKIDVATLKMVEFLREHDR